MDKREYFFKAITVGNYKRRDWLVDILGITLYDSVEGVEEYPYRMVTLKDGTRLAFIPEGDGTYRHEPITGGAADSPLVLPKDPVELEAGMGVTNFTGDKITTNYGCVLLNMILSVYPFDNKIPFINVPFSHKKLERALIDLFDDLPEGGDTRDPNRLYYDNKLKYDEATDLIRGIGYLVNPSGSRRTFTVAPEVIALRNALYEKHKDELDNPAILAMIAQQLEDKDRESMKGDISEGFFVGGKIWSVARMKTFIMVGIEPSLSDEVKTKPILTSLSEGLKVKNLPDMVNGQRYGSYSRGKLTEFGGVIVKLMAQAFRDTSITEDDCGTNDGVVIKVNSYYVGQLEGQYLVGGDTPLTREDLLLKEGQYIKLRSPSECKTAAPGRCAKCVGTKYAKNRKGLSIAATTQGSIFMGISMARMHGKSSKTRPLDLNVAFR